ncbi:phage prohead protease, HK97 family/phage major capsid protein, HK97 family [Rhizobium leguminosarum bv. trifolii WSM597]|uniref:Phage prohead protease, HK97 family/phage major capsid protein, HK97 family n=1 Tax=Rhizobium leguminosarum bv. trifolii WSM597 TaxID=754764 RepID=I9X3B7_RHILT|nr:phage major capsid protein [Rhizobium leguminosarum]EJB03261.1 phage prohead protease, HK97 family/phage major capsid protein, HK97 family [Rhizobium leguminosarum bv. trifolii WSM597]
MTERLEIKAALTVDDAGTITGIAWPFGSADRVGDVIEKGAFTPPEVLPMLFAHDQAQVIGVWDQIEETSDGLTVKGRLLVDDVERAREVRAMIRTKAVSGLSIGFRTKTSKPRQRGRTITALDLHEISVVAVPSHPGAQITSIKAADGSAEPKEPKLENEELEMKNDPVVSPEDLKALKADIATIKAKLNRPTAANNNHPAAENDNGIEKKAFADYLRSGEIDRKALTVADDAPGYVLAPEETSDEFIRNLVEFSPVRSIADVRTTGSHTVILPKRLTVTNAKWKGEAVTSEASEPTFDQMEFSVKEATTHVDVGNWLMEDASHDVEAEIRLALAEDFGAKEGLAFVNGSTAVEPKGFMAEAGISNFLNGHATNLDPSALIKLMYSLPGVYRNRGTWAMNGTTLAVIRTLKDGNGNYLWQPSYQAGQPETILGRPVVELIDMPDVAANAFPIIFGDFKAGYRIYDRIELQVRPNPYLLATEGMIRFHARRRVGAGVVRADVFRKLKMATS